MQVVIFCGGRGSRMGSLTEEIPKPLIPIQGVPIVQRVMDTFKKYNTSFILLTGYKHHLISEHFITHPNVTVVNTGIDTPKGSRLIKVLPLLHPTFVLTYADGLIELDPYDLLYFHRKKGYTVTITAVHPPSRFGEIKTFFSRVTSFEEKPQTSSSWINGGFQVVTRQAVIQAENHCETEWESQTLSRLAFEGSLGAYKYSGWWCCADTPRDIDYLNRRFII
jgi:glucose-1-phosphate cytidylyltransferase